MSVRRTPPSGARLILQGALQEDVVPSVHAECRQANLRDFLGVLVFDQWMGNADSRQAIFFRASIRDWKPGERSRRSEFVALMIDHGFIMNGPHWEFNDSPIQGLYHRPVVYEAVTGWNDFQPWLDPRRSDGTEQLRRRAVFQDNGDCWKV